MIYDITKFLFFLFLKIFFSLQMHGRENIPRDGAFIIASNHASYLDPFAAGIGCRQRINFMAKEELFKNRFLGWYLGKLHVFPLKRDTGDTKALKEAFRRLRKAEGLMIFPEGTRSEDGQIKEGKLGISILSHMAKAPVIPCYIGGSFNIWPSNGPFSLKGKLNIYYGKPLEPLAVGENTKKADYYNFAQKVMSSIKSIRDSVYYGKN